MTRPVSTIQGHAAPSVFSRFRQRAADWDLPDRASRVIVGGLFLALALRIGADFVRTLRVTGLLLLASEALVVLLTLVRRRAGQVDRTWQARMVTGVSVAGPPLVDPSLGAALLPDVYTAAISACGLVLVVAGKLSLGRSFGLIPANRGVVSDGLYRFVRHPIYAGYLVTHGAFVLGHVGLWNAAALFGSDLALVIRAGYEERTLVRDPLYASYREKVRWRLLPGVY